MTWTLVRKLLRDVRVAWLVAAVLLFLFQILWVRVTSRVTSQIVGQFDRMGVNAEMIKSIIFSKDEMPGQMIQAIIGGENIAFDRAGDMMSIAYVHPLVMTILCIWAIGRAANAIAGEIDRGTMELLLAQPIRRAQIVFAHLAVDAIVFPALCAVLWLGTYCGTSWMGLQAADTERQHVDPFRFLPALLCMLGLLFATSGMTIWISSLGRSRAKVWGLGITLNLCMFLVNVLGQVWPEVLDPLRPFTIHYHYQPQVLILQTDWYTQGAVWLHLAVLFGIGALGYLLALWCFTRRDLPAPL